MKLSKHSLIFKWAYLFTPDYNRPINGQKVDLCRVFWRCVLTTPALVLLCAMLALGTFAFFIVAPVKALGWWGLLFVPAVIAFVALFSWIERKIKTRRRPIVQQPSIVGEFIKGVKQRYCPIVEIGE